MKNFLMNLKIYKWYCRNFHNDFELLRSFNGEVYAIKCRKCGRVSWL